MPRKKRNKRIICIDSLNIYNSFLEEIRELSKSNNGVILVDSTRKMMNLDKIVENEFLDIKSTDVVHYDKLKNILYLIEFKNGSLLEKSDISKSYCCSEEEKICEEIKKERELSRKSKRKEIIANLALKGLDTYLIALKRILSENEYKLILDKKVSVVYIIVNSYTPKSQNMGDYRKKSRIRTLSNVDSINSKIPTVLKRYEKTVFDKVIFESDSYFLKVILPTIY